MHSVYLPESTAYWLSFCESSLGSQQQYQLGGELPAFPAYAAYHRGPGLGSFFKSLFRMAMPLLKSAGKQALTTGSRIAADLADGRPLSDSMREHGRKAASNLLHQAADKIVQKGSGLEHTPKQKTYKRLRMHSLTPVHKKKRLRKVVGLRDIFTNSFKVPPTQVAIKRSFRSEVQLQNPCTNEGPYEFKLSPDLYMLDLSKNYVYLVLRITKPDGSDCKVTQNADTNSYDGDLVLPVNLIGKTFFRQIKVFLNGKLLSDSGDKYAYGALIETELNFSTDAKHSQLQAGMYYADKDPENNLDGMATRMHIFKNSAWVEVMAPLPVDLFMQDLFLINQCELHVELHRNSDTFCIIDNGNEITTPKYQIQVKQMSLFVRKVEVSESIIMAIESMLQKTTVKYPIRRTQIRSLLITENRRSMPLNSLFNGILPRRLVIGLVLAEAVRGTYKINPFSFQDFGLSEIKITCGTTVVPSVPYKLDFEQNSFVKAYTQMFEGLNIARDDKGNMISMNRFRNGSSFFVFELGSDGSDSSKWELVHEGTTTLEMLFGRNLPAGGIECIVYAEFDSLLMIDHTHQAYMDYTV